MDLSVSKRRYLLVIALVTASCMLLTAPVSGQIPEQFRFQTSITVEKQGTDTILRIKVAQPAGVFGESPVPCDVVELEIDGISQLIRLVWWNPDWTQLLENYCIILNTTAPFPDLTYPMNFFDWVDQIPRSSIIVTYNLGEVMGTPPMVKARAHMFMPVEYTPEPSAYIRQMREAWGEWSASVEALAPDPVPLVEIATVIGVGGIAIAVLNNYWTGRREKQMTEVTRTAAEDERFMELYNASRDVAFQETLSEVLYHYKWTDYEDFLSKYGPETNVRAWAKIQSVAQYFEGIGVFVEEGSVDIGRVHRLLSTQITQSWEKLEPIIYEQRKRQLDPHIYNSFESLYFAIKRYQQEGPPPQDDVPVHQFED